MLNFLTRTLLPAKLQPSHLAKQMVIHKSGGKVMTGPFAGMIYITSPQDFIDYTMLQGTYEKELSPAVEKYCTNPPSVIVDVGAAQGYYAVGFAMRCPKSRVVAFETNPLGRDQIARKASANGVADRVEILGHCEAADLKKSLTAAPSSLIIMDIEGGEKDVLDPAAIPDLRQCAILVEEHSAFSPGLDQLLVSRFSPTHDVVALRSQKRSPTDLQVHSRLLNRWLIRLLSEGRKGSGGWFWMTPKL